MQCNQKCFKQDMYEDYNFTIVSASLSLYYAVGGKKSSVKNYLCCDTCSTFSFLQFPWKKCLFMPKILFACHPYKELVQLSITFEPDICKLICKRVKINLSYWEISVLTIIYLNSCVALFSAECSLYVIRFFSCFYWS